MLLQPQDFEQSLFLFDSGNWLILLDSLLGSGNTHSRSFFLFFTSKNSVCGKRAFLGQVINAVIITPPSLAFDGQRRSRVWGLRKCFKVVFCSRLVTNSSPRMSAVRQPVAVVHISAVYFPALPLQLHGTSSYAASVSLTIPPLPPPFLPKGGESQGGGGISGNVRGMRRSAFKLLPPSLIPREKALFRHPLPLPHHPHATPCRSL